MTLSLVVGVDAGATSTRVAVHTLDGVRVGYARAGAGNPTAHGLDKAVAAITGALREALSGHDGSRVVASRAGVAGHVERMLPELDKSWADLGIPSGPRITADVEIAYAAGTPSPDGSLLLSGTGAVAAAIRSHRIDRIADGLGWLLGDLGSGFWIGRAAARHAAAALDASSPDMVFPDELTALVLRHFLGDTRGATARDTADRFVRLAQRDHMRLAELASPVNRAAADGDPAALAITRQAADHLVSTVRRVHVSGPVVLAGSVLTNDGPVRSRVLDLLAGEQVRTAGDAAGAAAWLAAHDHLPEESAASVHAAFTGP
ncbi:N-acetylglucosamine kinase [Nonomuraea sp. NPDC048826]|uniref:N-acetylglucosamine kinase n=1 Tax=Nonomuraea sp. NPDC048826 TaxID=3364347 RepID=UPI003710A7E0